MTAGRFGLDLGHALLISLLFLSDFVLAHPASVGRERDLLSLIPAHQVGDLHFEGLELAFERHHLPSELLLSGGGSGVLGDDHLRVDVADLQRVLSRSLDSRGPEDTQDA